YHCLGQVLFWSGETTAALNNCRQSIALNPNQAAFQTQLGAYLTSIGELEPAIAAYQQAIKLDPHLPDSVYAQLIKLMLTQKQITEALDVCTVALANNPNSSELYYHQGQILAASHRSSEAICSYEKAVELQPDTWDAYQSLGDVLSQLNRQSEAQHAYQQAEVKFYQSQKFNQSDLPKDFDWQIYLALNPEFSFQTKFEAIAHLFNYGLAENKLYSLKHLHDPDKRPDIAPQSVIEFTTRPIDSNSSQATKLAVLVHIYYFDLWSELSNYIQNIDSEFDLYVNIVASIWQPDMHRQIRADFPQAKILISPNRGKDIGGHLSLMSYLDFAQYNLFCLIHTKKSPYVDTRISDLWRHDLLAAILGSTEKARNNLAIMNQYTNIGLMGSRYWRSTAIANNRENYQYLLDEFAIQPTARNCEYLSGTMMLVRPQIMQLIYQKLHHVELESGDNQELSFHIDGQIAHAVERIIGNLVRNLGFIFFWQE
ncbi:MAG: rhamnan synthesis F family protein, partial [Patescibacteria group bacterium]